MSTYELFLKNITTGSLFLDRGSHHFDNSSSTDFNIQTKPNLLSISDVVKLHKFAALQRFGLKLAS